MEETKKVMSITELDLSASYTYADYMTWAFDDRLELIKGKIFTMSPAPDPPHQRISMNIASELFLFLKKKSCEVFSAPFDVRLSRKKEDKEVQTVVQPDLCVVCDPSKVDYRGCLGAPDIVVEILSPGNNKKELQNKYEVYEESGVKEYWLVSPQDKTFIKYILNETGTYVPSRLLTSGDEVTTPLLPGFILNLEEVFSNV